MTTVLKALKRTRRWAETLLGHQRTWETHEYFDESWKTRIQKMASYIGPGERVVDLGCGEQWLKSLLNDNSYHPVDYKKRDATVTVANFNKREFPDIDADVAFVSGALEYVQDHEWFIAEICSRYRKCIISYCTTDNFPNVKVRKVKAWRNHLSRAGVLQVFEQHGMQLATESTEVPQNPIFVFARESSI